MKGKKGIRSFIVVISYQWMEPSILGAVAIGLINTNLFLIAFCSNYYYCENDCNFRGLICCDTDHYFQ